MQPSDENPSVQPVVTLTGKEVQLAVVAPHSWELWLPFPLSSNNLFAHRILPGRGYATRYPTPAYRRWRKEAELRICAAKIPLMREPVVVKLELTPPNNRTRDADNFTKGILDALVAARVLPDDNSRWVKAVIPYWLDPHKATSGVRVTIRVAELALFKAAGE
jgi:Holliday junction resolvase RusA-like endonuclease